MVILNMIIAFMSNLFSALEEVQQIIEIKEKAKMTLDLEVIIRFFKTIIRRNVETDKNNRFVFIIQSKEKEQNFFLDEIDSGQDAITEENNRMVQLIKEIVNERAKGSENIMVYSLNKIIKRIDKLEKKVQEQNKVEEEVTIPRTIQE